MYWYYYNLQILNNVITELQNLDSPPSGIGAISRFWLSYLGPFALFLPKL